VESEKRASEKRRNKYDELLFALTQLSPFEIVWGKFVAKDENGRKYILNLKTLDEADEEVLVESATYHICSKYGIDTFENFYNYISDWTKNKSTEEQEKLFAGAKYVAREFTKLLDNELVHVRNYLYEEAVNLDWERC